MQYVATCDGTYDASEVWVTSDAHYDWYYANPGAAHLPMIKMQAGDSVEVTVYTLFGEADLLPHDW